MNVFLLAFGRMCWYVFQSVWGLWFRVLFGESSHAESSWIDRFPEAVFPSKLMAFLWQGLGFRDLDQMETNLWLAGDRDDVFLWGNFVRCLRSFPDFVLLFLASCILVPILATATVIAIEELRALLIHCRHRHIAFRYLAQPFIIKTSILALVNSLCISLMLTFGDMEESQDDQWPGGVHILQRLNWLSWQFVLGVGLFWFMEHIHNIAQVDLPCQHWNLVHRARSKRRQRCKPKICCRKLVLSWFLLLNLASAEMIRVVSTCSHSFPVLLQDNSHVSQPCGLTDFYCWPKINKEGPAIDESQADFVPSEVTDASPGTPTKRFFVTDLRPCLFASCPPDSCLLQSENGIRCDSCLSVEMTKLSTYADFRSGQDMQPSSLSDLTSFEADSISFMQRLQSQLDWTPLDLAVAHHVIATNRHVLTKVWLHPWLHRDQCISLARYVAIDRMIPAEPQLVRAWADWTHPRGVHSVVVNPSPTTIDGPRLSILALPHDDETYVSFLAEYEGPDAVYERSCLLATGFPYVRQLFDLVAPLHQCQIDTVCTIAIRHRRFFEGQRVPLHEGVLVKLFEVEPTESSTGEECSTSYTEGYPTGSGSEQSDDFSQIATIDDSEEEDVMALYHTNIQTKSSWRNTASHAVSHTDFNYANNVVTARSLDEFSIFQRYASERAPEAFTTREIWEEPDGFEEDFERYQDWRHQVAQATRLTTFFNFEIFAAEAQAFYRSRGSWPCFVIYGVGIPDIQGWHLQLDRFTLFEYTEVLAVLRGYLTPAIPRQARAKLTAVRPFLTVHEQHGEDDLYLLAGFQSDFMSMVLVSAIWTDSEEQEVFQGFHMTRTVLTDEFLQLTGLDAVCDDQRIKCHVSFAHQQLPLYVTWKTFDGMKIDVAITRTEPCHAAHPYNVQMQYDEPVDETTLLQMTRPFPFDLALDSVIPCCAGRTRQHPYLDVERIWPCAKLRPAGNGMDPCPLFKNGLRLASTHERHRLGQADSEFADVEVVELMQLGWTESSQLRHWRYPHPGHGSLLLNELIAGQSDVLRMYLETHFHAVFAPFQSIDVWGIEQLTNLYATARLPHQVILFGDRSVTKSMLHHLAQRSNRVDSSYLVAQFHPTPPPTRLRSRPIDVAVTTTEAEHQGWKSILVEFLLPHIFLRTFLLIDAQSTVLDIVFRLGLQYLKTGAQRWQVEWRHSAQSTVWQEDEILMVPNAAYIHLQLFQDGCPEEDSLSSDVSQESLSANMQRPSTHADPTFGAVADGTYDETGLMQIGLPIQDVLIEYLRRFHDFRTGEVYVTVYVHPWRQRDDICNEKHIWIANLRQDVHRLLQNLYMDAGWTGGFTQHPIDPDPVYTVLERPTIVVVPDGIRDRWPILFQYFAEARRSSGTILFAPDYPPFSVQWLFALIEAQHDCHHPNAICHIYLDHQRFEWQHDIPLYRGAFVKLHEVILDSDTEATTCSSRHRGEIADQTGADSDLSWEEEWLPEVLTPVSLSFEEEDHPDYVSILQTLAFPTGSQQILRNQDRSHHGWMSVASNHTGHDASSSTGLPSLADIGEFYPKARRVPVGLFWFQMTAVIDISIGLPSLADIGEFYPKARRVPVGLFWLQKTAMMEVYPWHVQFHPCCSADTGLPLCLEAQQIPLAAKGQWVFHSWQKLAPPGNTKPEVWLQRKMNTLDDLYITDHIVVIHDWKWKPVTTISLSAALPAEPPTMGTCKSGAVSSKIAALPEMDTQTPLFAFGLPSLQTTFDSIYATFAEQWPDLEPLEEDLPLCTMSYLRRLPVLGLENAKSLIIYTDGSYFGQEVDLAGWSYAVFGVTADAREFKLHAAWGPLPIDSLDQTWSGAVTKGSRQAETEALIRALAWRLASAVDLLVSFRFDSQTTGFPTSGLWTFNCHDRQLRVARALAQAAETIHPGLNRYEHVHAHTGVHGNELVDQLAKSGAYAKTTQGNADIHFGSVVFGQPMPLEFLWLWLVSDLQSNPAFPAFQNGALQIDTNFCLPDVARSFPKGFCDRTLETTTTKQTMRIRKMQFGFATYNVCSLAGKKQSDILAGRCAFLRERLQAHGVHIAFLQETRAKQSGINVSHTHIRVTAAAKSGCGGTEIWILRTRKGTGKPLISNNDVIVLHADPECLIIRIRYFQKSFMLTSGHAPQSAKPAMEIKSWWERLTNLCAHHHKPSDTAMIVGLDANSHFAEEVEPWIGSHGLEAHTNVGAHCFQAFLTRFDLFLPATFEAHHSGETGTWRRTCSAQLARCDYLALPLIWNRSQISSKNLDTVDAGTVKLDHCAVAAWVDLTFSPQPKTNRVSFNRQHIKKITPEQIAQLSEDLPDVPWNLNVHEHACVFTNSIADWLASKFPAVKNPPRRSYISEATWAIRKDRLHHRRALQGGRYQIEVYDLAISFVAWKEQKPLAEIHDRSWEVLWLIFKRIRQAGDALGRSKKELRQALRQDRNVYLESVTEDAIHGPPNELYKQLRRVGVAGKKYQRGVQPLPYIQKNDGSIIESFDEWAEEWRDFFARQEDGVKTTKAQLLELSSRPAQFTGITWDQLPTLTDLEAAMRRTKGDKAYFEDNVPGEILHAAATVLARKGYPLLLKHFLLGQEPVLFKGGNLVQAYKHKGDTSQMSSYRSLLVSSTLGKVHHRLVRQQLAPYLQRYSEPLQLGGLPQRSVTQASHALHAFLHDSWARKMSTVVVFVDIQQAFYRVLREHIVDTSISSEGVRQLFDRLQLPPDTYQDFCLYTEFPGALRQADIPDYLQSLMQNAMTGTWFSMKNTTQLTLTRKGTRPGDSYADLLFSFTFARLMKQLGMELQPYGVLSEFRWSGEKEPVPSHNNHVIQCFGPIWADDLAIMLRHSDPTVLLQNASIIVGKLFDRLTVAGMTANLGPGKTEALIRLVGKNSSHVKKVLAIHGQTLTTVSTTVTDAIRVTDTYKHLGVWLQANGSAWKDLRVRFAAAHTRVTQYKTSIFGNQKMLLSKKMQLFASLVISALHYNLAVWMPFNKTIMSNFTRKLNGLLRRVAFMHFGLAVKEWRQQELHVKMQVLPPVEQLHTARLRYLHHLITAGDTVLWAILQQNPDWWNEVARAVQWMQNQRRAPLPFPGLLEDWDAWKTYIAHSKGRWMSIVGKAGKHVLAQAELHQNWDKWHYEAISLLQPHLGEPIGHVFKASTDGHACMACKKWFSSKSAWSVHAFRVHARVTPARLLANDQQCGACLQIYQSQASLVRHLTYSQHCRDWLRTRQGPLELAPGLNSRHEQQHRSFYQTPPIQAEGPELPPRNIEAYDMLGTVEQEQWNRWTASVNSFDALTDPEKFGSLLIQQTQDTTLHFDEIHAVFEHWIQYQQRQCTNETCFWNDVHLYFQKNFSQEIFMPNNHPEVDTRPDPHLVIRVWLQQKFEQNFVPKAIRYRPILVAHLFSGHRRLGDLQEELEKLPLSPHLRALSVDIVFSEEHGNLANPAVFHRFRTAIEMGILVACVSGPPCESWSRARLHGKTDGGPDILRSVEHLPGLPKLFLREFAQVAMGNLLLGISILLAILSWINGCFFLIEHPADPPEVHAASIWRIDLIRLLTKLNGIKLFRIWQGLYGAISPKPTNLLMIHPPPSTLQILRAGQSQNSLPKHTSIGKMADGTWATMTLKAYPRALCATLARIIEAHVQLRGFDDSTDELPEDLEQLVMALCVPMPQTDKIGPDFHPVIRCTKATGSTEGCLKFKKKDLLGWQCHLL